VRIIPSGMVANLTDAAPRWAFGVKIMPVAPGVPVLGLTNWDIDLVITDLDGPLTYKSKRGYNSYAIASTADLSVDNSEMEFLIAEFEVDGITSEAIRTGKYDGAKFIQYIVNPDDIVAGKAIISSGYIGRMKNVDGLVAVLEARSLTQVLKQQSIIEMGSNSCRDDFGGLRCMFDVETLWNGGEVDTVGTETDREFTLIGSDISGDDDFYVPGKVKFLTGANAGREFEVESYIGGVVTLMFPTDEPIGAGDELEIRPDCTHLWGAPLTEDHNSCNHWGNRPQFAGEPKRPVSETAQLMAPGGGTSNPDNEAEAEA
jgi:uncharacterized phage protein (TIGR02218 family)